MIWHVSTHTLQNKHFPRLWHIASWSLMTLFLPHPHPQVSAWHAHGYISVSNQLQREEGDRQPLLPSKAKHNGDRAGGVIWLLTFDFCFASQWIGSFSLHPHPLESLVNALHTLIQGSLPMNERGQCATVAPHWLTGREAEVQQEGCSFQVSCSSHGRWRFSSSSSQSVKLVGKHSCTTFPSLHHLSKPRDVWVESQGRVVHLSKCEWGS